MSDDAGQALGSALGPHHAFICCLMQLLSLLSAVVTFGSLPNLTTFPSLMFLCRNMFPPNLVEACFKQVRRKHMV